MASTRSLAFFTIIQIIVVTSGVFSVKDIVTCVYTSWSASRRPIGRLEGGEVPEEYCTHFVYAYTSIFVSTSQETRKPQFI